jgi:AAA+ ATPase superfamily predicted ATPase
MDFSLPCSFSEFPDAHTFVGREKELADIREALQGDASRRYVVVLQGLGGIGKTQLAVEYLKRNAGNYSAIIWLDGKTEDSLRKSFALTARRLHKCHAGLEKLRTAVVSEDIADTLAAMKDWLSIKGNHRWLIVFDNVDNPELLDVEDQQAYDVQAYFPETHQGSIIVTTRSSRLEVGKVISVSKLSNQESIEILSSTSGRAGLDQGMNYV